MTTRDSEAPHRVIPVSRAWFARRSGKSRATISRATQAGGRLAAAMIPGTDRLDRDHPVARAYLGEAELRHPCCWLADLFGRPAADFEAVCRAAAVRDDWGDS